MTSFLSSSPRRKNAYYYYYDQHDHEGLLQSIKGDSAKTSKDSEELLTPVTQASTVVIDLEREQDLLFASSYSSSMLLCETEDDESTIASTEDDLERRLTNLEHEFELQFELSWSCSGEKKNEEEEAEHQVRDIIAGEKDKKNNEQLLEMGRRVEQDYSDTDSYQLTRRRGIKVVERVA